MIKIIVTIVTLYRITLSIVLTVNLKCKMTNLEAIYKSINLKQIRDNEYSFYFFFYFKNSDIEDRFSIGFRFHLGSEASHHIARAHE